MLHIVHGDSIDHDDSVIFPADERKKEITATLESLCSVIQSWRKGRTSRPTVMEDVLLQQAFGGASFQHVRDDDGGLAALKVWVVPTSRYGDPKAEPWCLHGETTQITERKRKIITCF